MRIGRDPEKNNIVRDDPTLSVPFLLRISPFLIRNGAFLIRNAGFLTRNDASLISIGGKQMRNGRFLISLVGQNRRNGATLVDVPKMTPIGTRMRTVDKRAPPLVISGHCVAGLS